MISWKQHPRRANTVPYPSHPTGPDSVDSGERKSCKRGRNRARAEARRKRQRQYHFEAHWEDIQADEYPGAIFYIESYGAGAPDTKLPPDLLA